ncbi:MAG: LPP20 family lipoprotein [Desulfobacteraceae bacterium]|jgi:hypothetical protein
MIAKNKFLIDLFIRLSYSAIFCLIFISKSYADGTLSPSWIENPPQNNNIYYGIGVADTKKSDGPNEEEKTQAYNDAVTELSHMAGTMIYSSFKDYQRETTGSPGQSVAEQEVVSSVKNISENFLQGITIRDRYQDRRAKQYYVFVVIDRKEANRQIKENIAARETKLQKVINVGIKRLDQRIEQVEADVKQVGAEVGKVSKDVGSVKKNVGKVEEDLAKVDERVDKSSQDISDLFNQMEFVKDKIESLQSGEMNWSKGLARVKGMGLANPNFPVPLQKRSAEEAARMDAQAKLVELTNDLKIKVTTHSKNNMVEEDIKTREFEGVLHGAHQVGETIFNDDGTAEVVMEAEVR